MGRKEGVRKGLVRLEAGFCLNPVRLEIGAKGLK